MTSQMDRGEPYYCRVERLFAKLKESGQQAGFCNIVESDFVKKNSLILLLRVRKMEIHVTAPLAGTIACLHALSRKRVKRGQTLGVAEPIVDG